MKNSLIFLLTIIILSFGCKKDSIDDSKPLMMLPLYKYYYVKGILINNFFIDTTSIFYYNLYPLNNYDTCYYNDFSMQFYYDTVLIKEEPGGIDGINSSYKLLNVGNIESINVFSNPQYNSNFNINTPLNDIIKIGISYDESLPWMLNSYVNNKPYPRIYSWYLGLTEAPDTTQVFIFTFVWEDNRGNHFEKQTNPVCLTP